MTTQIPAWLNSSYAQNILRNFKNDNSIEVSDIIVKPATAKGDNYTSDMYRVNVEFSRIRDGDKLQEKECVIVKCVPESEVREEMTESTGIFKTEMKMMSATLPKMNETLKSLSVEALNAECFYAQYQKPIHLVIEDLATRGFRMADRQAGLDLEHCLIAIRNLGRFHAASIAVKEKDPELVSIYKKGILHESQPLTMHSFFDMGVKNLAHETTKWHELNPRINEKLRKLSDVFYKKGCEAARFRENDFNVLNHGDFWVNNMLFRYDEHQKPVDYIFVDFQLSCYASPAVDILYFLGTSPTDNVRLHHRELLLREYYHSLCSTMAKLKCDTEVLSFEKLQQCLEERAFLEVVAAITVLPFVVLERGEEINIEDILAQDASYNNPGYRGKTYRKIITRVLPLYDNLGLLDV